MRLELGSVAGEPFEAHGGGGAREVEGGVQGPRLGEDAGVGCQDGLEG